MFQDKMKSFDTVPGCETVGLSNKRDPGNQSKTSNAETLLLADPMRPCRRSRAVVKGQTDEGNH